MPNRKQIETAAKCLYDLLTAARPSQGQTPDQHEAHYWQQAATLSHMLLGPVANQLGKKRLLIVAEGALQYIPFAALPRPSAQGSGVSAQGSVKNKEALPRPPASGPRPLIVEHEVINLPSATALAVLRRETAARKAAPKAVAVLADPVFEEEDPRIKHQAKNEVRKQYLASNLEQAVRGAGLLAERGKLSRLPFSRDEAEAILTVAPAGLAMKALDFKANRATAMSRELSQYRIVHFATHGLLNSEHPELSGIVLSLIDEQGRPQDGFLRLHEVYNMDLPAELVVLSACRTALGKEVKGEGLVGLTRGFMYTGAKRVMASLWNVNDSVTAELMKRFYEGMFRKGLGPAAALREAQKEMMRKRQWRRAYYWGGFVMQGDWR